MTPLERRASASLAAIFALRMLGLFLVLPVFALEAQHLPGGNDPALVGLAMGVYGLTQALLQMPLGMASDRWGRKPVILAGLAVFALGSALAAWAPSVHWLVAARALQGAGASDQDPFDAQVADQKTLFSDFIEHLPIGLCLVGKGGKVLMSNPAYRHFLPDTPIPSLLSAEEDRGRWRSWDKDGKPVPRDQFVAARGRQRLERLLVTVNGRLGDRAIGGIGAEGNL